MSAAKHPRLKGNHPCTNLFDEFNRSQFRLYAAIGQPALGGVGTAAPQPVAVPVMPVKMAPGSPPNPRPVPGP